MQIPPIVPTYVPRPQYSIASAASAVVSAINNQTEAGQVNMDAQAIGECATCATRRYQDDSLDGGVSMQQPTHVSIHNAASAVIGHEREHQGREARFAEEDGREIIYNEIHISTCICPECGRVFVSGGENRVMTRERNEQDQPMSVMDVFSSMGGSDQRT
jgi:hypothetical protein